MENQNKKSFSTILMMVGVLCIVISGGIFVSRTWQYLPEVVKKLCLVAVAVGFFGGSCYLEKKSSLRKAPVALYYLGVCFTGFSVLAFLPAELLQLPERLTLAMLGMSVPVILRFVREKGLADLIIQICLTDGMILCVAQFSRLDPYKALLLSLSAFTMLLAGMVYYCKKESTQDRELILTGLIAYGIHAAITVPMLLWGILNCYSFLFSVLPVLLVTGSVTALYLVYETKVLRIVQSFFLLLCCFSVAAFVVTSLPEGMVGRPLPLVAFLAFLAGLCVMLVLRRDELLAANAGLCLLYTFVQVVEFTAKTYFLKETPICYPYGICIAVAGILWFYLCGTAAEKRSFYKMSAMFFLVGLNAQAAAFWREYALNYGVIFWLSLQCLLIAFALEWRRNRCELVSGFFKSFALLFALVGVLAHKLFPVVIYGQDGMTYLADFSMEYDCFFAGVGIVLLGIIWYSIDQGVRVVQFVGTCLILGALLLHNLAVPALPNVMFLGLVTLGMLVLATVLKQRNYAIASAATLALVVLYLTKEVWMSIAWWVYLFVAGVGLVIFAIKKEKAE